MNISTILCLVAAVVGIVAAAVPAPTHVGTFPVRRNHFGYTKEDAVTFPMTVLTYDGYVTAGAKNPPIFFYTGNEGEIQMFYDNTGAIFDHAKENNGLVVFCEHRYYGATMPFGKESFLGRNPQYLSSAQALADYVSYISHLRTLPQFAKSAVIAMGGSYGGMLSSYIRIKYPGIVDGALAASAPVLDTMHMGDPQLFSQVVTDDFGDVLDICPTVIRKSWGVISDQWSTAAGRAQVAKDLDLCSIPDAGEDSMMNLYNFISSAYTYLAMVDYPTKASFLQNLPAFPVNASCTALGNAIPNGDLSDSDILKGVQAATKVYYLYEEESKCLNTTAPISGGLGMDGWNYQSCSEFVLVQSQDGVKDMFWPMPFDIKTYSASCEAQFNVVPTPNWIDDYYFAGDVNAQSKVIYSRGSLDPWSPYSPTDKSNAVNDVIIIEIVDGAHHLDLRSQSPNDPQSAIDARALEGKYFKKWIAESNAVRGA